MEQIVEEASPNREETAPLLERADPSAHKHKDVVQRQTENHYDE